MNERVCVCEVHSVLFCCIIAWRREFSLSDWRKGRARSRRTRKSNYSFRSPAFASSIRYVQQRSKACAIKLGEGVWVNVTRSSNWLKRREKENCVVFELDGRFAVFTSDSVSPSVINHHRLSSVTSASTLSKKSCYAAVAPAIIIFYLMIRDYANANSHGHGHLGYLASLGLDKDLPYIRMICRLFCITYLVLLAK